MILKDITADTSYCTITNISSYTYYHIAITKQTDTKVFKCYKNGGVADVATTNTPSAISTYPKNIFVGKGFNGFLFQFRF